jgi:hypothetical protein
MAWRVTAHSAVQEWFDTLDEDSEEQVTAALRVLRQEGPALGRPFVDTITGARHTNLKELRPGSSGRSKIRILFAFDPERAAILLVGGDKAGEWSKWYRKAIPLADDRLDQHNARLGRKR